jgi:hypothetical protein
MKSLRHICEEADKEFKDHYSGLKPGELEKVAEDWINGNEQVTILGYKIIPGDKVYIAVKNSPAPGKPMFDRFYVLRFFPGGKEGWYCSEDLGSKTESEFIQFLMKKMQ